MNLIAHLTDAMGVRQEQTLKDHCLHTAAYASECVCSMNLHDTAYLAGLLHDMGKAKAEFTQYLEAAYQGEEVTRGAVNHTFIGVIWLFEHFHTNNHTPWERLTCEIISYAIGAHHGMFDCVDLEGKNGFDHRLRESKSDLCYEEAVTNFFTYIADEQTVAALFEKSVHETRQFFEAAKATYGAGAKEEIWFQIGLLTRLVLSAVIYGDRKDTSEFMNQCCPERKSDVCWNHQRSYFEHKMAQMDTSSALNQVRNHISRQCLSFAEKPPGIYRLNVPTGAGKTLCTLRYALAHAETYKKKRIIFIIPLLSVLDQNVKVIRDFLPDGKQVLEHHSNVVREKDTEENLDFYECLTDDWNAPVIVSTLVQLLNLLFKHQTSAIRRMQALCDSVVVIDEVQSLPKKTTILFNRAMNFLQQHCNATIVLSSATQPCFDELKWPLRLAPEPDMVRLNKEQLRVFQRVQILDRTDPYGMDWDDCAKFCGSLMAEHPSLLIVCNTKSEARILFENLQEHAALQGWDMFHLSTSMCQKHRMEVLETLREKLSHLQKTNKSRGPRRKLICVSTQLIEAGVDLSFSGAVRILAGIDNLAQTAGRCNRSNEYGKTGKVYLIKLKNENLNMLKEIRTAQHCTLNVLRSGELDEGESLIGEQAANLFYRHLFRETTDEEIKYPIKDWHETHCLTELLSRAGNGASILNQPFKTVGKEFQVFDENTTDILVPYGEGQTFIQRLQNMPDSPFLLEEAFQVMRQAKAYTISVYQHQKQKLDDAGLLRILLNGRVLALDQQAYDDQFGLNIMEEQPVDHFIL